MFIKLADLYPLGKYLALPSIINTFLLGKQFKLELEALSAERYPACLTI